MRDTVVRADKCRQTVIQLKQDVVSAEQAIDWITALCWWLHYCSVEYWDSAESACADMERARTS
jgi:hypothetical protein